MVVLGPEASAPRAPEKKLNISAWADFFLGMGVADGIPSPLDPVGL